MRNEPVLSTASVQKVMVTSSVKTNSDLPLRNTSDTVWISGRLEDGSEKRG